MFAQNRINQIAEHLKKYQSATVSELSEKFSVSEVTVRKDLSVLEADNLIERSFGGAIWIGHSISNEISNEVKMVSRKEDKARIAKKIITEINEGDTIFLDAGSTNNILVSFLKEFSYLTVLTNDLLIAIKLSGFSNFKIILIGGEVSNISKATVDYMATQNLSMFNVDTSIIGCDSFSINNGACTTSVDKAALKSMALSIASKKLLSTTSDKHTRKGLVTFADLSEFDKIYTDNSISNIQDFKELDDVKIEIC
jgi:DeoR/GlpR family transcriptional regulator of sugar metabolism